ncbi:MAG: hypothetical protein H7A23_18790 [Leptospiraceae bacterium]|nr:hypothetical protein [Leptospiraceae bacterium]
MTKYIIIYVNLLLLALVSPIHSTYTPYDMLFLDYQSITGLYGSRSSGLGGAFTAVADDPSGAYYNPAGLIFSPNDSLSISGNAYRLLTMYYQDVEGPGRSYLRKSEDFFPNFIGATR